MKQQARFLFLGTGASMGVPLIGCKCSVCQSGSPFNERLRSSALITINDKKILIDSGPDLRQQALKFHVDKLDGVLITHAHHDHTGGVDDLRIYSLRNNAPLPCVMSQFTHRELKERYGYIFVTAEQAQSLVTRLEVVELDQLRGQIEFLGMVVRYLSFEQAGMQVNGFRLGNLAYISDICHYPETIFADLEGIDSLIISSLRYEASDIHLNVEEAVAFSRKTGARQTWLMHTSHELDYEKTNGHLPSDIRMAYDGLEIDFLAEM